MEIFIKFFDAICLKWKGGGLKPQNSVWLFNEFYLIKDFLLISFYVVA